MIILNYLWSPLRCINIPLCWFLNQKVKNNFCTVAMIVYDCEFKTGRDYFYISDPIIPGITKMAVQTYFSVSQRQTLLSKVGHKKTCNFWCQEPGYYYRAHVQWVSLRHSHCHHQHGRNTHIQKVSSHLPTLQATFWQ